MGMMLLVGVSAVKNPLAMHETACNAGDSGSVPGSGRLPLRRELLATPVFLPGKVHGQRSLAGCSPWGYMTEHVCMRVESHGLVAINW